MDEMEQIRNIVIFSFLIVDILFIISMILINLAYRITDDNSFITTGTLVGFSDPADEGRLLKTQEENTIKYHHRENNKNKLPLVKFTKDGEEILKESAVRSASLSEADIGKPVNLVYIKQSGVTMVGDDYIKEHKNMLLRTNIIFTVTIIFFLVLAILTYYLTEYIKGRAF